VAWIGRFRAQRTTPRRCRLRGGARRVPSRALNASATAASRSVWAAAGLQPGELAVRAALQSDPEVGGSMVRALELWGKGELATAVKLLDVLGIVRLPQVVDDLLRLESLAWHDLTS